MSETREPTQAIVTADLLSAAQNVIRQILDATSYPATLRGKLGTAETAPLSDPELARRSSGTARDISDEFAIIKAMLLQADKILDAPLANISQRRHRRCHHHQPLRPQTLLYGGHTRNRCKNG